MKPDDKLEVVGNLREAGFDITQKLLAPMVAQVEKYANQRGIEPSEERVEGAVSRFIQEDTNKFSALLNNGESVQISQQQYISDASYNFLPIRYKTLIL